MLLAKEERWQSWIKCCLLFAKKIRQKLEAFLEMEQYVTEPRPNHLTRLLLLLLLLRAAVAAAAAAAAVTATVRRR
jgi:hypothetical protein